MIIKKIVFNSFIFILIIVLSSAESQSDINFYKQTSNFTQKSSSSGTCSIFPYFCLPNIPCDGVIDCAMETQRDALEARLDDLINTIKANTKQTEHQTKIIEQEVLAYTRLLKRMYQESLSLKEARHLSKKIKDSEALGTSIDIIKKGI